MQITVCKKSIERLGASVSDLLSVLRDREHSPIAKDCLDRCGACLQGLVIASAGGMPIGARSVEQFLADVDALAADE